MREWYLPADRKSVSSHGDKRKDLPVRTCFAPLLGWLRREWPEPQLALALDASTLGERFVLLAVSVLYRRCAIPVAWKVLPATAKGSLETALAGSAPGDARRGASRLAGGGAERPWPVGQVAVPEDPNPWLASTYAYQSGGHFRPDGSRRFVPLKQMVPKVGRSLQRRGHGVFDARADSWQARCWVGGAKGTRNRGCF